MPKKFRAALMLTGCIGGPFLLLGFYTAAIVPFHDPASGFKHKSPAYMLRLPNRAIPFWRSTSLAPMSSSRYR